MQRLVTYCCWSLLCLSAASQKTVDVDKDPGSAGAAFNYLYTVGGTPFVTAKFARVVEGSPFFKEQIMPGSIILSEGKEYKKILVRLNLLESQVNYLNEKEVELIASIPVREVVIWDTIFNNDHRFIFSDFIETTDKPEKGFYELLQTGKAELYKQYSKRILENKPYGSATVEQTIQTNLRYFVLLNGKWIKLNKVKDLPTAFPDKKEEISKFINDKKLSGDSEKIFEAVVTYYNSIAGNR